MPHFDYCLGDLNNSNTYGIAMAEHLRQTWFKIDFSKYLINNKNKQLNLIPYV